MCGRYQIELPADVLREVCESIERNKRLQPESYEQLEIKFDGEVFPTDVVPVLTEAHGYVPMKWGFCAPSRRPVINARIETAHEKPLFRSAMLNRRCLVPASAFYEWQQLGAAKAKCRVYQPDQELIFFAGCYREENDGLPGHFVILTQAAAPELVALHDRMPVIARPWQHGHDPGSDYDTCTSLTWSYVEPGQQLSLGESSLWMH